MTRRFFAFGCSFTKYGWPTWADYVGVNFDEYYNFAESGGSNSMILYNFTKALDTYKFNSEQDYVAIMFTSHHRYSFRSNTGEWSFHGDVLRRYDSQHNWLYSFFKKNLWSIEFGVLQSWVAAKVIKEILVKNDIKHKFMLIDTEKNTDEDIKSLYKNKDKLLTEFLELTMENETMTDFRLNYTGFSNPIYYLDRNGELCEDSHPSTEVHYKYFQTYFKQFDTDRAKSFYEEIIKEDTENMELYNKQTSYILSKYCNRQQQLPL